MYCCSYCCNTLSADALQGEVCAILVDLQRKSGPYVVASHNETAPELDPGFGTRPDLAPYLKTKDDERLGNRRSRFG